VNAPWDAIALEMGQGALAMAFNLLKVIIPLMVGIELILTYGVVEKIAPKLGWFCRLIGVSRDAIVPLLVGLLLGVTYGAGALAEINRRTPLSKNDLTLLGVFLFSCHGIIETTYLFWMAGASALFVSVLRLAIAVAATAVAARFMANRRF
jgi:hypothetical protein